MEIKTASTRTEGLVTLFDLQTRYFERALDGVSDEDAHKRLDTKANHIAWIAGSLVFQRYEMIKETHPDLQPAGNELFNNWQGIKDDAKYPSLAQYLADWQKISPIAREILVTIDDDKLDTDKDMGGMKWTYFEITTFTLYREASMIGQIALWRRLLDYPGMKYD